MLKLIRLFCMMMLGVCLVNAETIHPKQWLIQHMPSCSGTNTIVWNATTGTFTCVAATSTLAGDVDGASGSNDIDEAACETELEGVMDLQDMQGAVIDGQIPSTINRKASTVMEACGYVATAVEGQNFLSFQSSAAITITRATINAQTDGVDGGAQSVTLQISDGTTDRTCTFACNPGVGVGVACDPTDLNVAANTMARVQLTAATTCATNPTNLNICVEYIIQ